MAAWLAVPVVGVSQLGEHMVTGFLAAGANEFFHAVTVPDGWSGRMIIHNDLSALSRQRSNVAHELGHIYLDHPPCVINNGTIEDRSPTHEREADWFGFSLLVTNEAALALARSNLPVAECAALMGVSEAAVRFRLDASGARKRVARERDRRGRQ